jgi:hypothetical protein
MPAFRADELSQRDSQGSSKDIRNDRTGNGSRPFPAGTDFEPDRPDGREERARRLVDSAS